MADWDADSPELQDNLRRVISDIRDDAARRSRPTLAAARNWHATMMDGLDSRDPLAVGRFRGEAGLEACGVRIGRHAGTRSDRVADELDKFERDLQAVVRLLDDLIAPAKNLTADDLGAVLDLCAWTHAEWVRIHLFRNGNGRTARMWANLIALRYGLPPFVRSRPRPGGDYGRAAAEAMSGNWRPTATVFRRMYSAFVRE